MLQLQPFLASISFDGRYVRTDKGRLARELQKSVGDVVFNTLHDESELVSIEVKAEEENLHGNFFLETWSNRERFTPGWMLTLNADLLFYYFIRERALYVMRFQDLKRWAFGQWRGEPGHLYEYPEKAHGKRAQPNLTMGRCVPIRVIEDALRGRFQRHEIEVPEGCEDLGGRHAA